MELAGPFQCFGIVVFVVTTSATFFNGVDLAVVFLSTLAPVIVMAVTPLITLVTVVAGVVALVAAVKIDHGCHGSRRGVGGGRSVEPLLLLQ